MGQLPHTLANALPRSAQTLAHSHYYHHAPLKAALRRAYAFTRRFSPYSALDLLPHDHYETRARERALSRLVASALAPAKGAWGARWRLDSNFAAALPQEMNLGDPRAFALALVANNPLEALCGSVETLVDDAERFGGLKAAWLAPYHVHVSKTVTMLCVDFAARDPVKDCTAVATTVQFVAREA